MSTEFESGKNPQELGSSGHTPRLPPAPRIPVENLTARVLNFEGLSATTKDELLSDTDQHPDRELISVLREIVTFTKAAMGRLNREQKVIPPDSIEDLIHMLTLPGARACVLRGQVCEAGGRAASEQLLGYLLIFTDKEFFPDKQEIPSELLEIPDACRANRFFLSDEARAWLPQGKAASLLLDKMSEVAQGAQVIGKVLVDERVPAVYREARAALELRGFEPTSHAIVETFKWPDGRTSQVDFGWYLYPPFSDQGQRYLNDYRTHLRTLETSVRQRLSWTAPYFPVSGSRILCISGENDAWHLAGLYPGNFVIDKPLGEAEHKKAKPRKRPNLRLVGGSEIDEVQVDALFLSSIFSDPLPAPASLDEATCFLIKELKQLKVGGHVIIRDSEDVVSAQQIKAVLRDCGFRLIHGGREDSESSRRFVLVGEKIDPQQGVCIREVHSEELSSPAFLSLRSYDLLDQRSGRIIDHRELVGRPNATIDVIPWFETGGRLFVMAKDGFPRPLLTLRQTELFPDSAGYITEQIAALVDEKKILTPSGLFEAVRELAAQRMGIDLTSGDSLGHLRKYLTLPDMVDEMVTALDLHLLPTGHRQPEENYSGFSTSGLIKPLDAIQLLQACQTGGMADGRLERMVYELLARQGRSAGPWIGRPIALGIQDDCIVTPVSLQEILVQLSGHEFREASDSEGRFFTCMQSEFTESNAYGEVLAGVRREFAVPCSQSGLSSNRASVVPLIRTPADILVGIEIRDLPAASKHFGVPSLPAAPVFTLPEVISSYSELERYVKERLQQEHGARALSMQPLGGAYNPSPGIIPGWIQPLVVEIDAKCVTECSYSWLSLKSLPANAGHIRDAQLLTGIFRAAHALELLA